MQTIPPPESEADRYALSLLEHDGLMTPRLQQEFGPMRAIQLAAHTTGTTFRRQSILRTQSGDHAILEATLEISLAALPKGFLERLVAVETPFGQLLQDYMISIEILDRQTYRKAPGANTECRWGRRLTMRRADTSAHLCDVDELLVPGQQLISVRRPGQRILK
jgi:hypothetical protein